MKKPVRWLKKGLSLLLALMMCTSLLSVTAFAAGSTSTTRNAIRVGTPTDVEDGVYYADVNMKNASRPDQYSMGNAALRGSDSYKTNQSSDTDYRSIVVVKDGKATALLEFMPMGYIGMYGFMLELEGVYAGSFNQYGMPNTEDSATVFNTTQTLTYHKTQDGLVTYDGYNNPDSSYAFNGNKLRPAGYGREASYVNIVNQPYTHLLAVDVTPVMVDFEDGSAVPTKAADYTEDQAAFCHVFVPVMFDISASSGDQYARLQVDWTSLTKIEDPTTNLNYMLYVASQTDTTDYTASSVAAFNEAYESVHSKAENIWPSQTLSMGDGGFKAQPVLNQTQYTEAEQQAMAKQLSDAINGLTYADKTALQTAVDKANALDTSLYTAESLTGLNTALTAARKELDDSTAKQAAVDAALANLNTAMNALVYKAADYTAVDAALKKVPADLSSYTLQSAAAVNNAVDAVVRGKNITEQAAVNAMARAIEDAVAGLTYKSADYTAVDTALAKVPGDLSYYTEESAAALNSAVAAVDRTKNITEQAAVDAMAQAIENAITGLTFRDADYTAVDLAKAKVPSDLTVYTDDSVAALNQALSAAEAGKDITEQEAVNAMAKAIEDAIAALTYKDADYTAVDAALAKVPADLGDYTDVSKAAVEKAVAAVVRNKNITEQSKVDEMAQDIEAAVAALTYKSADYTAVDEALAKVPADLSQYTDDSKAAVEKAVAAVDRTKNITQQADVDAMAKAIDAAVAALTYRDADYTAVDAALKSVPADLSGYTDATKAAVEKAVAAVVRDKKITEQADVDAMAKNIQLAVAALEKKPTEDKKVDPSDDKKDDKKDDQKLDWNNLADGTYSIEFTMVKMNRVDLSMSNDAVDHTAKLTVKNGQYTLTMNFKGLHYLNRFGYLGELSYYTDGYTYGTYGSVNGTLAPATVVTTQKNSDGSDVTDEFNVSGGSYAGKLYPQTVSFPVVNTAKADADGYIPLHVFVPVMDDISAGTGAQDVLMKLDKTTLKTASDDDSSFNPSAPEELSPAVDVTDSATGVKVHADAGVLPEGTKVVITPITSGDSYTAAAKALDDAGKKFKLYDVKFVDANGNEIQTSGTVSVSIPIASGYDAANVMLYRINADGTKTLIKGEAKDGFYTVVAKSFGTVALVEKGSTITDAQNTKNVGNAPKTGDSANVTLAVSLMALAAVGAGALVLGKKRENTGE